LFLNGRSLFLETKWRLEDWLETNELSYKSYAYIILLLKVNLHCQYSGIFDILLVPCNSCSITLCIDRICKPGFYVLVICGIYVINKWNVNLLFFQMAKIWMNLNTLLCELLYHWHKHTMMDRKCNFRSRKQVCVLNMIYIIGIFSFLKVLCRR
jgi:hypothetical protein